MNRPLLTLCAVAAFALAGAGLLAGCDRPGRDGDGGGDPPAREFNGQAAFAYLQRQLAFGPRVPGTEGHRRTAEWLEQELRARADTVLVQRWTHVTLAGDSLPMVNLVARFNPAATERVLYLAHWDTRPMSDQAEGADSTKPVPGANDGASGVALLLGIADLLDSLPTRTIGVDLLFVDGEDYGVFDAKADVLIGSRYYAAHQAPGAVPKLAVLWDMVADADLRIHPEGNSLLAAPDVVDLVWSTAQALGYAQYFDPTPKHTVIDDHVELQKAGIKAIDVLDFDYPAWHTPGDTIDKVSANSLKVVGDVAAAVLRRVDAR